MAHYSFLDENSFVVQVIVGKDEDDLAEGVTSWEEHYGSFYGLVCKRTSYNTLAGKHIHGGTPFRGNYGLVGYEYREDLDAFIPPKPYDSWMLNESIYSWESPVPYPENSDDMYYEWNESTQSWDEITE